MNKPLGQHHGGVRVHTFKLYLHSFRKGNEKGKNYNMTLTGISSTLDFLRHG